MDSEWQGVIKSIKKNMFKFLDKITQVINRENKEMRTLLENNTAKLDEVKRDQQAMDVKIDAMDVKMDAMEKAMDVKLQALN